MSSDRFHISCPGCGTQVAVSMAHVGKKGRCPSCKTVFPITAPAAAEPVVADLVPIGSGGLQPLSTPGLQPLGSSSLQPIGSAGLQPLGSQPFGSQPFGSQPFGSQPFGSQPSAQSWPQSPQPAAWQGSSIPNPYGNSAPASPFGQPAASPFGQPASAGDDELRLAQDANPYASPTTPSYNFAPAKPQKQADGEINGSLWGGIGMMVLAVVWFFGALIFFNVLFIYPPILFIIGLIAFVKGLVNLGSN
jgi:predicted Zn finger-like uncharacterized protein